MIELVLQIRVQKGTEGLTTSFSLLNETALEAFGPWRGLPEAISGLLHCALLLESRMQIMRTQEEGCSLEHPDLSEKVGEMLDAQIKALLPQAIERSLADLRI